LSPSKLRKTKWLAVLLWLPEEQILSLNDVAVPKNKKNGKKV